MLAGALANVEIGDEIPTELYKAVAEVLGFVLGLSRRVPRKVSPDSFDIHALTTMQAILRM